METVFKTFIPATNRPQIADAVREIVARHKKGATTTAIVMPPRVGKSNVIRLAALELTQSRHACAALALAPWDNLADQLVSTDKTRDMLRHYKPRPMPDGPEEYRAGRIRKLSPTFHEVSYIQHLWTATVQMVNMQMPMFRSWLERCASGSLGGSRPIIFIDEGHLLSESNRWGEIATAVEEFGAHIVLLTGTPYRADTETIPGFTVEVVTEAEDIQRTVVRKVEGGTLERRRYEGTKSRRKLVANYEMTLQTAWALPALCKVEAHWIDPVLRIDGDEAPLSVFTATAATKHLRRAVQDEKTIQMAAERAVQDMRDRRAAGMKDASIIVVTTSDLDSDGIEVSSGGSSDWHARRVRDAFRRIDPSLNIQIATQSEENEKGTRILRKFSDHGVGDVLIVKNMGTVGLDCARIKTVVLLGTTRQLATWMQTMLRGATMAGAVSHFTLILTDDIKNRENWDFVVAGQGGEYSATDLKLTGVETDVADDSADRTQVRAEVLAATVTRTQDSHHTMVVDDDTLVRRAIAKSPLLRERMSIPEIMAMIKAGVIQVDTDPMPAGAGDVEFGVVDTGEICTSLRGEIEALTKEIANRTASYAYDKEKWIEAKKHITYNGRQAAGLQGSVTAENDRAKLARMRDWLQDHLQVMKVMA